MGSQALLARAFPPLGSTWVMAIPLPSPPPFFLKIMQARTKDSKSLDRQVIGFRFCGPSDWTPHLSLVSHGEWPNRTLTGGKVHRAAPYVPDKPAARCLCWLRHWQLLLLVVVERKNMSNRRLPKRRWVAICHSCHFDLSKLITCFFRWGGFFAPPPPPSPPPPDGAGMALKK